MDGNSPYEPYEIRQHDDHMFYVNDPYTGHLAFRADDFDAAVQFVRLAVCDA